MNIVLLCAGTSSRMGSINKMLIPYDRTTIIANSAMQALKYLDSLDESSTLIIVTGYRKYSAEKALKPCKDFVSETGSRINMIVVFNKDYKDGQFSSVQTGVREIPDGQSFFISLADMPKITDSNYRKLEDKLESHDAVRVVCNGIPGHPVLLAGTMKNKILHAQKNNKVGEILKKCDVRKIENSDSSFVIDIDTPQDLKCLN